MDVFMDDNSASNTLTFLVELYGWNAGETGPKLSMGGGTANDPGYNHTILGDATTILNTQVAATGVADAAWESVTLGSVDLGSGYDFHAWRIGVMGQTNGDDFAFDNLTVTSNSTPGDDLNITSFASVDGSPDTWQLALKGRQSTSYILRTSTNLAFDAGSLVENLDPGVPASGSIGGANDSVVTTDVSGNATVRLLLTGPRAFVRAETAP